MTRKTRRTTRRSASSPATRLGTTRRCARPRCARSTRSRATTARARRGGIDDAAYRETKDLSSRTKTKTNAPSRRRSREKAARGRGFWKRRWRLDAVAPVLRVRRARRAPSGGARRGRGGERRGRARARAKGLKGLKGLKGVSTARRAQTEMLRNTRAARKTPSFPARRGGPSFCRARARWRGWFSCPRKTFSHPPRSAACSPLRSRPSRSIWNRSARRPRVSESTAAPPPAPPAARSRFTPASLRGALLAGSSRATAAAFAAAAAGTVPAEELFAPPAEGQDAGELVEVVTVR